MRNLAIFFSFTLLACSTPKTPVDQIFIATKIYVCNEDFDVAEAMAISQGKIVAYGTASEIQDKYEAASTEEVDGFIYPGLIDAHSHFYGFGRTLNKVDLRNTFSLKEVADRTINFGRNSQEEWITGRGWDQTIWTQRGPVNNTRISIYSPDRPIFIKRIDGHAGIANARALELAGITTQTRVDGGTIEVVNGKLTGLLTDNAMELVDRVIPEPSTAGQISALLKAQEKCLAAGLTTVTDAGLDLSTILLIDSLQKTGDLKIRIYAMANPNEENFAYFEKNGPISTAMLQVSSMKLYADGALGSRGAKLKKPYCDHGNNTGVWVTTPEQIDELCARIVAMDFQANTHAIGDSANSLVLKTYAKYLIPNNDNRWRIEHAQVVTPSDRNYFTKYNILPSVQPTHATSDMRWAQQRLCDERMKGAYAYKSLLELNGWMPLGTDFPVEDISPLRTFYSAVYRKNADHKPINGFRMEEALSPEQTLLGMTLWAARANRMEDKVGSLEAGKLADFTILDKDIIYDKYTLNTNVLQTILAQ